MATRRRATTKRKRLHCGSRSAAHRADKKEGEARRAVEFIGVTAPPRPSPLRDFSQLEGHEFTRTETGWQRCHGPDEFGDFLEEEASRRDWFFDAVTRKGKTSRMKRRAATPIEVLTVTFAPWLSDWVAAELAAGRYPRPRLAKIRNAWMTKAAARLEPERYVLGVAVHVDTDDIHFDLPLSRQSGNGERRGAPGLGLVGPWSVGADRQARCGAQLSREKRAQLSRNVAIFQGRSGPGAVPLDVELARALDESAGEILGEDLAPFIRAYAASVPDLERAHARADLAALDAARSKLAPRCVAPPAAPPPPSIPL